MFTATGCGSCHQLAAAGADGQVGPSLDNISEADEASIEESIVDPGAVLVEGYGDGIMPQDYRSQLSAAELDSLVKYLLEAQE